MKVVIAIFLLAICSCEKDINFRLDESSDVLVVDAEIENNRAPSVILTKSLSFFDKIDTALLAGAFVHNAEIYISNGITTHRLKEYSFPLVQGYIFYFYSTDSSNLATAITGEYNRQYCMRIVSGGQEYRANTTIPPLSTYPDSVYVKQAPFNPDTNTRALFIRATDPRGLGNYVRYFTKRNTGFFLPGENSVYNDQVIDGITYDVQLPQGIDRNNPIKADDNFFNKGDTITLKFCNIDKAAFTFWSTWEFAFQGIGNPFAQPNKVQGNISNGALGAFCGYAAWYRTIIAQ